MTALTSNLSVSWIVSGSLDGHRRHYLKLFSEMFPQAKTAPIDPNLRELVGFRGSVFIVTLEGHLLKFLAAGVARSILGRRTACLFLRPRECFRDGLKYGIKRQIFQAISRFSRLSVISVISFSIEPQLASVAKDWIDDPQLWDLEEMSTFFQKRVPPAVAADVRAAAGGRRVVMALGAQSELKGFPFLVDVWLANEELRRKFLFCVAGAVDPALEGCRRAFEESGGWVLDRFVSDDELLALYQVADLIWACYAPQYDQASGIFGRAYQLGIPCIVRRASFIERHAQAAAHPICALDYSDALASGRELSGAALARRDLSDVKIAVCGSRARAVRVLKSVL